MILKALFFNYDLEKAVSDPRLHNQLSPNTTVAEPQFDKVSIKQYLQYVTNTILMRMETASQKQTVHTLQGSNLLQFIAPKHHEATLEGRVVQKFSVFGSMNWSKLEPCSV